MLEVLITIGTFSLKVIVFLLKFAISWGLLIASYLLLSYIMGPRSRMGMVLKLFNHDRLRVLLKMTTKEIRLENKRAEEGKEGQD